MKSMHTYYIKFQNQLTMRLPQQASWMVRKLFNMRKFWPLIVPQQPVESKGKFQINRAYKMLRGEVTNVPWRTVVCHNATSPKHIFILWLALLGKMRTKDRLISWGLDIAASCILCNNQPESLEHLYFDCYYSKEVWKRLLHWLGWQRRALPWAHEWRLAPKNVLLKACFAAVVYEIWTERNSHIFKNKSSTHVCLIHTV